jgi:hypothetical protein
MPYLFVREVRIMKTIVVFAVASLSELGGFGSIEMPALGQNSRTSPLVWHYITQDLQVPNSPNIVPRKLQPRLSLLPRFKPFPQWRAKPALHH